MTSLPDEFCKTKYPYRYRLNVGATGIDRTMRWLRQAAENLGMDIWLVTQQHTIDPDPNLQGTTDVGIGLQQQTDYDALINEFDTLAQENFDRATRRQAIWEARVERFEAANPDSKNPELDLIWEDEVANTQPRQIARDDLLADYAKQAGYADDHEGDIATDRKLSINPELEGLRNLRSGNCREGLSHRAVPI